jgi:tetratricopeptide (TPR) repeat protein
MNTARGSTAFQIGDRIGDRYQVYEVFVGGMGEVYLCLDEQSRLPCALKRPRLRPERALESIASLGDEVRVWMSLGSHPNVVECLGLLQFDGHHFIQLEWVLGAAGSRPDLRSLLTRRGKLVLQTAAGYVVDIARGLCHAQSRLPGLVHRDLKPENVLLGSDNRAKITDFGLAVLRDGAVQGQPAVEGAGTYFYMAPEQWRGEPLDPRTDIYAVGCIFFELLAGHPPFAENGILLGELRQRHLTAAPAIESLPGPFGELIQKCLSKSPDERFAGPERLLEALEESFLLAFGRPLAPLPSEKDMFVGFYGARAIALSQLHLYDEALLAVWQAIEKRPDDQTFRVLQGRILFQAGRGQQAREVSETIDETKIEGLIDCALYAILLADLGRVERAEQLMATLFEKHGTTGELLEARASVRIRAGRFEEAIADFRAQLEFGAAPAGVYINISDIYLRTGRPREALAASRRAVELDPGIGQGWLQRGLAEAALGRIEKSVETFRQGIRLSPGEIRLRYNLGVSCLQLKRYQEAVEALSAALRFNPHSIAALGNRGGALCELGRVDEGLADWNQAIELSRTRPLQTIDLAQSWESMVAGLYSNRGSIHAQRGDYHQARQDFLRAAREDESSSDARMRLGYLCLLEQNTTESVEHFQAAYRLGETRAAAELHRLGVEPDSDNVPNSRFSPALIRAGQEFMTISTADEMRQFVAKWGEQVRTPFWAEVMQALLHESPEHARERVQQLAGWFFDCVPAARPPSSPGSGEYVALLAEGDALFAREEPDRALRAYLRAVEVAPDRARGHGSCGLAWQKMGSHDQAADSFTRALDIDPADFVARLGRANSLGALGRFGEARADCDELIRARPDDPNVRHLRGRFLVRLGALEEAAGDYELVCAARPDLLELRLELCGILGKLNRIEEAMLRGQEAIRLAPDSHHPYLKCFEVLIGANQQDRALQWISSACEALPRSPVCWATRGSLHLLLERQEEARADFARALRFDPYQPVAHFHLAQLALEADDKEAVLRHVELAAATGEEVFERARRQFRKRLVSEDSAPPSLFVQARDVFRRASGPADLESVVKAFPFVLSSFFQENLARWLAEELTEAEVAEVAERFRLLRELAQEVGQETVPPETLSAHSVPPPVRSDPPPAPGRAEEAMRAARVREEDGDLSGAVARAEEAVRCDPESRAAVLLYAQLLARTDRPAEAVRALTRFITTRPQPDREALEARGLLHLQAMNYQLAIADLLTVVEAADASGRACYSLGMCYLMLEDYSAAISLFDRAVENGYDIVNSHLNRSACYLQLGKVEESIAAAEASAAASPTDYRALSNLGLILLEQGRLDEALPHLDRARSRGDLMSKARAEAVREALRLGQDRVDDPVTTALRAVAVACSLDEVRRLTEQHPFLFMPQAVQYLQRVNQAGVNRHGAPLIPRSLAWLERLHEERDRARQSFVERINQLQQNAISSFRAGRVEKARALLEEAWGLLGEDEEARIVVNVATNLAYICSELQLAERSLELVRIVLERIEQVPEKEELTLVELSRTCQSATTPAVEGLALPIFEQLAPLLTREGLRDHATAAHSMLAHLLIKVVKDFSAAERATLEAARLFQENEEAGAAFQVLHEGSVFHLQSQSIDSADRLSARALEAAHSLGDADLIAGACFQRSVIREALGDLPQAVALLETTMEQTDEGSLQLLFQASSMRSRLRQHLGDLKGACEDAVRALDCAEKLGEQAEQLAALTRLGELYEQAGSYEEAVLYRRRELRIQESKGDSMEEAKCLHVLGRLFLLTEQYESAVEAYSRALSIDRANGSAFVEGLTLGFLGDACSRLERYSEAGEHYSQALRLLESCDQPEAVVATISKLATTASALGRRTEALGWSRQGLERSRQYGLRRWEARFDTDLVLGEGVEDQIQAHFLRVAAAIRSVLAAETNEALSQCIEEHSVLLFSPIASEWFRYFLANSEVDETTRRHAILCARLIELCAVYEFSEALRRLQQVER